MKVIELKQIKIKNRREQKFYEGIRSVCLLFHRWIHLTSQWSEALFWLFFRGGEIKIKTAPHKDSQKVNDTKYLEARYQNFRGGFF